MSRQANPLRGETAIEIAGRRFLLRPSFEALIAAEEELGSLFSMVERASQGALKVSEMSGLVWHCLPHDTRPERQVIGEAMVTMGLVEATRPIRAIFAQVLKGCE